MPKSIVLSKLFAQLGYTVCFVRDGYLFPVDHRIPIDCNTFVRASRASSREVSAIKKIIKIFLLTCNWPIEHCCMCSLLMGSFSHDSLKMQLIALKYLWCFNTVLGCAQYTCAAPDF